jgi:hypothetical protein
MMPRRFADRAAFQWEVQDEGRPTDQAVTQAAARYAGTAGT